MVILGVVKHQWRDVGGAMRRTTTFIDSSVAFPDRSKDPDAALSFCDLSRIASLAGSREDSFDRSVFLFTLE